jgi:ribosomal protein S20
MPIIKSAKKALKQNIKKKSRNDHFKNLYRETRVAFEKAVKAQDLETAKKAFVWEKTTEGKTINGLQSCIDKLVKKNIIEKNNGSRKKSLFAKKLKELELSLKS